MIAHKCSHSSSSFCHQYTVHFRYRWLNKEEYGKVPRYLQNIKLGLARQHADKQAAKEAAMVPPGMRIMPEEERLEMLGILDESRQDVEAKLQVTLSF